MQILTLAPGFKNKFLTPNSSPSLSATFAEGPPCAKPCGNLWALK